MEQQAPEETQYESMPEQPSMSEAEQLQDKTLRLLDYDTIREQLANNTTFFEARKLALELSPSFDEYEVERLQNETADARALLDELGDLILESRVDTSESVARAALGGVLTGNDLLAVAESLEVHRRARSSVLRGAEKAPLLADIARIIPDLQELQRQVRAKIGRRGAVVDGASPNLRGLRTQVRQAYERVTEALSGFMQSSAGRETLQDSVISVRGERLVVPVKASMRHRVEGIVHDASNSGATLFIEPFATVELGNSWRELSLEEEREVLRVLRDLSSLVGAVADDIRLANRLTANIDFALARARYSHRLQAVQATMRWPSDEEEDASGEPKNTLRLLKARHPMLGRDVVPLTLGIGPGWTALVITGPNTGGKTVAMKTVGLLALMHQSGLHIPADEGSSLPVFDAVYADVGDQQSIADSVSTFGSHIGNVVDILKHATSRSLVLMDELGTSTDPEEGSALAKAIIGHLAKRRIPMIVTTHHRNVAAFAEASENISNASFQLEPDTLRPTYELTMGVPGRSYAMAVAERLGLPEEIMEASRSLLEPQHMRFEDWLDELQEDRHSLQTNLEESERARADAEAIRNRLEEQVEYLADHRDDMLDNAKRGIEAHFDAVRQKLRGMEASLSWSVPAGSPPEARSIVEEIRQEVEQVEEEQAKLEPTPSPRRERVEERPIGVGDTVFVRGLNLEGIVAELSSKSKEAEIAVGNVRINVDRTRLTRVEVEHVGNEAEDSAPVRMAPPPEDRELDLRGMRADEALSQVEGFLDRAMLDDLSTVRIIHGRGTGALREAVRDHLNHHPLVQDFGPEPRERGGNGATWVTMS